MVSQFCLPACRVNEICLLGLASWDVAWDVVYWCAGAGFGSCLGLLRGVKKPRPQQPEYVFGLYTIAE